MKLSVILGGRNDGYCDEPHNSLNYLNRFDYCLRSLHRSLKNIDYEIIIYEVNPPKDKTPLSDIFKHDRIRHFIFTTDDFTNVIHNHFSSGARFIVGGRECSQQEIIDLSYNYVVPFKKYLIEARGEYILSTATDNIFPEGLEKIVKNLSSNVLYRCKRNNIDYRGIFSDEDFEVIMKMGKYNFLDPQKSGMYGGRNSVVKAVGDFMLMDKNSWLEIGGFLPIPSNRIPNPDNYMAFISLCYGKRIFAINDDKYYIANIHISPKKKINIKMNDIKMNYVIEKDGFVFDYFKEIGKKSEYRKYTRWLKDKFYDDQFLYHNFEYYDTYKKIKKILDSIDRN